MLYKKYVEFLETLLCMKSRVFECKNSSYYKSIKSLAFLKSSSRYFRKWRQLTVLLIRMQFPKLFRPFFPSKLISVSLKKVLKNCSYGKNALV